MTPETFTGCPESSVGENLALRAAATAACCKSGWPETAEAETTRPDSSTRICTVTVPEARAAFAMGGGVGAGGGGGGGSSLTSTFGALPEPLPPPPVPPTTPTGPVGTALTSPTSRSPTSTLSVLLVGTILAVGGATSLVLVTGAMTAMSLTIATSGSALAAGFGSSCALGASSCAIGTGATSVSSSR